MTGQAHRTRPAGGEDAPLTVGRLARRFGLSRSTLLYYDRVGLLRPSGRTSSRYRLYSENDCRRLERIVAYREAGLPLAEIRAILDGPTSRTAAILEAHLETLNREIGSLRTQQRTVASLLQDRLRLRRSRTMDKDLWVAILRATGLSEADMRRWHVEFEATAPEAHQDFLESLGIPPAEVRRIRKWSRERTD